MIAQVHEFLMRNSTPSGYVVRAKKSGVVRHIRLLTKSKRQLHRRNPEMKGLMSYGTWVRHVKKHHKDFKYKKKRVDLCSFCHKYDKMMVPKVRRIVEYAEKRILEHDKHYLDPMRKNWEGRVRQGTTDPDGKASLQYVNGLVHFLNREIDRRGGIPDSDVPRQTAAKNKAHDAANISRAELRQAKTELESCSHHFHSVRRQHQFREGMLAMPRVGEVDVQLDFKENVTVPFGPEEEQEIHWGTARRPISTLFFFFPTKNSIKSKRITNN